MKNLKFLLATALVLAPVALMNAMESEELSPFFPEAKKEEIVQSEVSKVPIKAAAPTVLVPEPLKPATRAPALSLLPAKAAIVEPVKPVITTVPVNKESKIAPTPAKPIAEPGLAIRVKPTTKKTLDEVIQERRKVIETSSIGKALLDSFEATKQFVRNKAQEFGLTAEEVAKRLNTPGTKTAVFLQWLRTQKTQK